MAIPGAAAGRGKTDGHKWCIFEREAGPQTVSPRPKDDGSIYVMPELGYLYRSVLISPIRDSTPETSPLIIARQKPPWNSRGSRPARRAINTTSSDM